MSGEPERYVEYDPEYRLALIRGPGGFTQVHMIEREAVAIAEALGIEYRSGNPDPKGEACKSIPTARSSGPPSTSTV